MQKPSRRTACLHVLFVFATLLSSAVLTGCGTVHVTNLREAQEDFSKLASDENKITGRAAFHTTTAEIKDEGGNKNFGSAFSWRQAMELHRGYHELNQRLTKMRENATGALANDKLYGVTATLEVLSDWRATFFGHLAQSLPTDTSNSDKGNPVDPKKLTAVAARAERIRHLADDENVKLFPRDRFILKAMNPLIKYDIAYLNTLISIEAGEIDLDSGNTPEEQLIGYMRDMAEAEQQLDQIFSNLNNHRNLARYVVLARVVMLQSAYKLAIEEDNIIVADCDLKDHVPLLSERIDHIINEATRNETNHNAIVASVLKTLYDREETTSILDEIFPLLVGNEDC